MIFSADLVICCMFCFVVEAGWENMVTVCQLASKNIMHLGCDLFCDVMVSSVAVAAFIGYLEF